MKNNNIYALHPDESLSTASIEEEMKYLHVPVFGSLSMGIKIVVALLTLLGG